MRENIIKKVFKCIFYEKMAREKKNKTKYLEKKLSHLLRLIISSTFMENYFPSWLLIQSFCSIKYGKKWRNSPQNKHKLGVKVEKAGLEEQNQCQSLNVITWIPDNIFYEIKSNLGARTTPTQWLRCWDIHMASQQITLVLCRP